MRELRKLSVDNHLKKHQEMYFGSRGANPQAIASAIAQGALVLGASRILIEENNTPGHPPLTCKLDIDGHWKLMMSLHNIKKIHRYGWELA